MSFRGSLMAVEVIPAPTFTASTRRKLLPAMACNGGVGSWDLPSKAGTVGVLIAQPSRTTQE